MNTDKVILVSGGPQQLLCLIALMRQLGKIGDVSGAVSYVAGDERIAVVDNRICNFFEINYIGSITNLNSKILQYAFGTPFRFLNTLFKQNACSKVESFLVDIDLMQHLTGKCIAMPYRKNLVSDNLLLVTLKPETTFFIPDGFDFNSNGNIAKRFFSFILGIENYVKNNICQIFIPKYLEFEKTSNLNIFSLDERYITSVYFELSEWYKHEFSSHFSSFEGKDVSIVIWNNIYPKFIKDKDLWLNIFRGVLEAESRKKCHILVKPHPRSSSSEIADLASAVPMSLRNTVTVLEDDLLVGCPVEVLNKIVNFKRVSGVYSTALLSFSNLFDVELTIYSHYKLPRKLKSEINRCAKTINIFPIELLGF